MILHRLQVERWRCFNRQPIELNLDEKVTIVHAPNGTGKSALFEALRMALMDSHAVMGLEIQAIQPWETHLSPKVLAEFSLDGKTYRISKTFLKESTALLEVKRDGSFVALAERKEADEEVRKLLGAGAPGRGLAKPEHWGWAQVLWAPQERLALGVLSSDLVTDIRASLGDQLTALGDAPLEKRIEEAYLRSFTPQGSPRKGQNAARQVVLESELETAKATFTAAVQAHGEHEKLAAGISDQRARREAAKGAAEALQEHVNKTRALAATYRELRTRKEKETEAVDAARSKHEALKGKLDTIRDLRGKLDELKTAVDQLKAEQPQLEQSVQEADLKEQAAREEQARARKGQDEAEAELAVAEEARRYTEGLSQANELKAKLKKIKSAQHAQEGAAKAAAGCVAPDTRKLKAIRKALEGHAEATRAIQAAMINLHIEPDVGGTLQVERGESPGDVPFEAGKPLCLQGTPEVAIRVSGLGRIRATGPEVSIEDEREKLERAEQRLGELTASFGTRDLNRLEELQEKASGLEQEAKNKATVLETLLSGKAVAAFETELAQHEAVVAVLDGKYPEWQRTPPDATRLRADADTRRRKAKAAVETAGTQVETVQNGKSACEKKRDGVKLVLQEKEKQREADATRLKELTGDGKDDAAREKESKELALQWDAAKAKLEDATEKLVTFSEDPAKALDRLEKQLSAADELAAEELGKEKTAEGRLEQLAAQGTYTTMVRAEEAVKRLEKDLEREKLRAEAVRLLRETVRQCRTEAVEAVAAPITESATRYFSRIVGTHFAGVRLDESLAPVGIVPRVSGKDVVLGSASGGEQEQVHFATRLALADLLAKKERQLVVFDDVLTFTDTGRLSRVLNILEEAGERLQILIFTCHRERYMGLTGAKYIDLETLAGT